MLAAIGRACHPTSKDGWYQWCKETSLEYVLKTSFANLDSQHFWDQMNLIPVESLTKIEEEILSKLIELYNIKLDTLLFLSNLSEDLRTIRLSCQTVKKCTSVKYQLEKIPIELKETLKVLCVNDDQIRLNLKLSGYIF